MVDDLFLLLYQHFTKLNEIKKGLTQGTLSPGQAKQMLLEADNKFYKNLDESTT